jgi:hypothetical protein
MKILRRVLPVALLIIVVGFIWIWMNRPQRSDMSVNAPASALVYLESNSLMNVADGMAATDSWKLVKPLTGQSNWTWPSGRTRRLIAFTGLGPTASVILARAQIAMVMLDLGAREEGDTMTLKPEAALLVETHTSKRRIKTTVEQALQSFAEKLYTRPSFKRLVIDNDEFLVWTAVENDRQIVAVIDESLVIVANSDRAVRACLEARRGLRANLHSEPELQQMRNNLGAETALTFGFVPSSHAPELVALVTPLALGRAPGDAQIDGLVARSAAKIISSAGWTAKLIDGAIEDHYLFTLKPSFVSRLRPVFQGSARSNSAMTFVPDASNSLTLYSFKQPEQTWRELQTSLSAHLDTLSAVLLTSILKSGLSPYGVDDPEQFLRLVGPEIATVRFDVAESGSVLVAKIRDEPALKALLKSFPRKASDDEQRKVTIHYQDGYVLIGSPEDVQRCIQAHTGGEERKLKHFGGESAAGIVTYSDDSTRVANFISAIARAQNSVSGVANATALQQKVQLPYAVTETSLSDLGLDRRTLSPFGQFSTLLPLLLPTR